MRILSGRKTCIADARGYIPEPEGGMGSWDGSRMLINLDLCPAVGELFPVEIQGDQPSLLVGTKHPFTWAAHISVLGRTLVYYCLNKKPQPEMQGDQVQHEGTIWTSVRMQVSDQIGSKTACKSQHDSDR